MFLALSAMISFLAPSFDEKKSINVPRQIAMTMIGKLYSKIRLKASYYVGRYNDNFNINVNVNVKCQC